MNGPPDQVAALIEELLSLNRTESVAPVLPLNAQEVEQREARRKKVRQELVQALSLRSI